MKLSAKPKISVVISAYKDLQLTDRLLSILFQTRNRSFEVVIIDDCSPVDLSPLKKHFPEIRYYRNEINLGVARARNLGVQKARGGIILSLDNDVKPSSDIISEVAAYFKNKPDAVAITGFPGTGAENPTFFARYKYWRDWSYWNLESDKNSFYYFRPAIGAIRRDIFLNLGGYDDRFCRPGVPAVEDLEFSYRLAKLGKIVYDPKLVVGHPFGGLRKLIKTYFLRSQLFLEIFFEKRTFSGVATTGGELFTLGFAGLSLLTLVLSLFMPMARVLLLVCLIWFVILQRKFLGLVANKEGWRFTLGAFFTSWLLYLVIIAGAFFAAGVIAVKFVLGIPLEKINQGRS